MKDVPSRNLGKHIFPARDKSNDVVGRCEKYKALIGCFGEGGYSVERQIYWTIPGRGPLSCLFTMLHARPGLLSISKVQAECKETVCSFRTIADHLIR